MAKVFIGAFLYCVTAASVIAQDTKAHSPQPSLTGYPPSVYMQPFLGCTSDGPCTRRAEFRVDPVPDGCCILIVVNGDGRGTDEVRSYEVSLNGNRVVPAGNSRSAQASVKVLRNNTIKVVLAGEPSSKVFVLVAYDPRQSK